MCVHDFGIKKTRILHRSRLRRAFFGRVTFENVSFLLCSCPNLLLRSEIPSGMCAKLRTVAASNNRDHPTTRSLYYCLFAPLISGLVLRSEIPSGKCAKLRTVAASNNRDHARSLTYYCLLVLYILWCYFSRTSRSW